MDSMIMMIAAGTHQGVFSTNGQLIGVEPVKDEWACDCGHKVWAHKIINSRPQGACSGCACKAYRNTLVDVNEADVFYAELKARLDERAPA